MHCALLPHMHIPPEQLLASIGEQLMQLPPPAPHAASVFPGAQRLLVLSQQLGHALHWQMPPTHFSPGPQAVP
jgi:hypothetical protein